VTPRFRSGGCGRVAGVAGVLSYHRKIPAFSMKTAITIWKFPEMGRDVYIRRR